VIFYSNPSLLEKQVYYLALSILSPYLGVGKSCILLRFTKEEFKNDYSVTIGVDFANKTIQIDQDTTVKLQIWDTVTQASYYSSN